MLLSDLVAEPNEGPANRRGRIPSLHAGRGKSRLSPPSMTVTISTFFFSCQTTWTVLSVFRRQIAFFFVCAHNVWMGRDRLRHVFQPKWLTTNTTWADCFFFAQEDPDLHSKYTPGPDIDLDPASPASTPGGHHLLGHLMLDPWLWFVPALDRTPNQGAKRSAM